MKELLVSATLVALFCTTAQAAPDRMSFTGRLSDEAGLINGPVQVSFAIFDAATGGTMLWEEAHSNIAAEDGLVFVEGGMSYPARVVVKHAIA